MFKKILNKTISVLITLFLICSASFFMVRALPGSPFDQDRILAPEIIANLEAKYGLNKSLSDQYFSYIKGLTKGDLGPSLKYPNRNVQDILFDALPVSLTLGFIAFVLALVFGFIFGILSALFPNRWYGKIPSTIATFGMSMPSFVFGAIMIWFFGLHLGWLPVALWEGPSYVVLPAITLSILPTAYITRITRSSMIDTLSKEHIKTALAKGLDYNQIVFKHGLRNSLLPILTVLGPLAAILITGSFVVEFIFALPGMGKYFVSAFINRDYFLVSGVVLIFAGILLFFNSLIELTFPVLDPKLKN